MHAVYSKQLITDLVYKLKTGNQLNNIVHQFLNKYGLQPWIGTEIEFYLSEEINESELAKLINIPIKSERGIRQFEITIPPSNALEEYANEISNTISVIQECGLQLGGTANFRAKPFPNDFGNSIHFHINFIPINEYGHNHSIDHIAHSICHFMLPTFLVFMPLEEDYLRIDDKFMTPTHVSYGGNNRTVALRIPDTLPQRLEHRLSSPSIDPYIAIYTILKSVLCGIESPQKIKPIQKIYGNASDHQYQLQPLPKSIEESIKNFDVNFFLA